MFRTVFAEPVELEPPHRFGYSHFFAQLATAILTALGFHAEEFASMEIQEWGRAFRVGALRKHGRLLLQDSKKIIFLFTVQMQVFAEENYIKLLLQDVAAQASLVFRSQSF